MDLDDKHIVLEDVDMEDHSSTKKNLWKIDSTDILNFKIQVFTITFIWVMYVLTGQSFFHLQYWDGPNYIYAAIKFYNIPQNNPWTKYYKYPTYYFACHLPGFPIVISIFSLFHFYKIGPCLAILFCSCLFTYVFRRFLIVHEAVKDIGWTVRLSLFMPVRFFLYKAVAASEPLYMSLVLLVFIFYKQKKMFPLVLCSVYACITRIEGLAVVGSVGLSFLLNLDIKRAIITGFGFLSFPMMALFHRWKFGYYDAYLRFNQGRQRLIVPRPFFLFIRETKHLTNNASSYERLACFIPPFAAACAIKHISLPLFIFTIVYMLYSSVLYHNDHFRYLLPAYVPNFLIGFDSLLSAPNLRNNEILLVVLFLICLIYSFGQIRTNICGSVFFDEVFS